MTLKSIAQNPEIHEGMTREEIDAAIARHAETEILYDRPYADPKVVRVAGPFTVESLSPHRVLADGPEDRDGNASAPVVDSARFVDMVLDNLRKAGVQNQVKQQRLKFETLDRFPGRAIQADGKYDEGGASKRAAVAIGPEYGTVGKELVREAAKEAADWADLLIVCGYAFDARAEEMSAIGRLPVVYARMNADLLLGDQLKKTGTGNLFTVFGQPDVEIRTLDDGQLQVDIRGIDVYDPTAGEIRSDAPDKIASWFIDTDYNGESFFVRHAYFCGGDRPYERLSKTLKADIDPEAWESLYSATSRPFPRPESGKIAVKVINHYGDEILKVYDVGRHWRWNARGRSWTADELDRELKRFEQELRAAGLDDRTPCTRMSIVRSGSYGGCAATTTRAGPRIVTFYLSQHRARCLARDIDLRLARPRRDRASQDARSREPLPREGNARRARDRDDPRRVRQPLLPGHLHDSNPNSLLPVPSLDLSAHRARTGAIGAG